MRVQQKCGCGAQIVLEDNVDLERLVAITNTWRTTHDAHDMEVRSRLWSAQAAVNNINAVHQGLDMSQYDDETNLMLTNLFEQFSNLNVSLL